MNSIENQKIIIEKNNKKIECDVLFTFECEDTGKVYIGYSDNSISSNTRKNIYVSSFDPIIGINKLEDIKDSREIEMVRRVLNEIDMNSNEQLG